MQTHVFMRQHNGDPPIPDECEIITPRARVNHREGVVIKVRKGWHVVPGVCCDEWDIVKTKDWTCPSCETPWHQPYPGLWRQGEAPTEETE